MRGRHGKGQAQDPLFSFASDKIVNGSDLGENLLIDADAGVGSKGQDVLAVLAMDLIVELVGQQDDKSW